MNEKNILFPCTVSGWEYKERNETPWLCQEDLEIACLLEGEVILQTEEKDFVLQQSDAVFLNQNTRFRFLNRLPTSPVLLFLVFSPRLIYGSTDSLYYEKYVSPLIHSVNMYCYPLYHKGNENKEILKHIEEALSLMRWHVSGYEFLVRNALSYVILDLCGRMDGDFTGISQKDILRQERIRTMVGFIEREYTRDITLAEIAASASLSVSACIRCFKASLHTTPILYLRQYRLSKSAELLAHTDMSVTDAAYACGFHEMSYYGRCFKDMYHMTPGTYQSRKKAERANIQKKNGETYGK